MMDNPFSLEGKYILVTGASSGIGRATAIACSQMGATVVVTGRNEVRLRETFCALSGKGHVMIVADLADDEQIEALAEQVPMLNGVAACAGKVSMYPFSFVSRGKLEDLFNTNFFGPVLLVKSLLKKKKVRKNSSIVFVSSIDGARVVHRGNSIYAASKAALIGMARNMALDLAPKKIRVNCVLPGTTDTPMIRTDNVTEEDLQSQVANIPLGRLAQPYDIANGLLYLLSDASGFVTGTELVIDGGYSIQ